MSATLLPPPTKPGFLTEARHVVLPTGIVSSALPAVRDTCVSIGLGFDPWQVGTAKCILGKSDGGMYAADTIVLSIPRQVGKTFLIGMLVFADSIINPGTTTVWTAHRFKVARETFNELKAVALSPRLAPHIDPDDIYTAAGNESITFRNGSRIVFAARERGAIRGFTKVRRLVLDEAQILSESAMSDLAPTQNQAVNPQIILMGTPPKPTDPGETFTYLRSEALAGNTEGVVYVEFSADHDCDIDDLDAWKQANPSLHIRTPVSAIRRLRKLLSSDDDFRREALGIWPDENEADPWDFFTPVAWANATDQEAAAAFAENPNAPWLQAPVSLGLEMPPDRALVSISAAGACPIGGVGVDPVAQVTPEQLAAVLVGLTSDTDHPVRNLVVDPSSPAGAFIDRDAEGKNPTIAGIPVTECSLKELKAATGDYVDHITAERPDIHHRNRPELTAGAAKASKRKAGDVELIDRWADPAYAPFGASILARWGHLQPVAEEIEAGYIGATRR